MYNENFYVFKAPLTFDPRQSDSYTRDVRKMLNALPRTVEPDPIHDIMNTTLKEWLANESKQMVKDDDIIRIYQNEEIYDGESTSTLPYYYLEWEPEVNFETWYLQMINTANAHGYTVYSDVDQRFYFPDGTSIPPNAHQHLRAMVQLQKNRIAGGYDTVLKIMEEEAENPPNPIQISEHLVNIHSRVVIVTAILQYCLDKHGIKAELTTEKGESFYITIYWQNEVQFILQYDVMDYLAFRVRLNLHIEVNYQDLMIKEKIRTMGFFDEWGGGVCIDWNDTQQLLIAICDQYRMSMESIREHSEKEWEQQWEKIYSQQTCNTITELNAKLTQQIDEFVQNVYRYGNLYDFFDALYQDSHPLHHYFWTSIYVVPTLGGILQLARYVGHPKLKEMIEKQVLKAEQASQQALNYSEKKRLDLYVEKYLPKQSIKNQKRI